jgi:hypothetical protein
MYAKDFIPRESDPEIFTEFMHQLGVKDNLQFTDVYSGVQHHDGRKVDVQGRAASARGSPHVRV